MADALADFNAMNDEISYLEKDDVAFSTEEGCITRIMLIFDEDKAIPLQELCFALEICKLDLG